MTKRRKYQRERYQQRPDVRAKQREYQQRPDVRAKRREYQREYQQRPDVRAKQREYQQRKNKALIIQRNNDAKKEILCSAVARLKNDPMRAWTKLRGPCSAMNT